MKTLLALLFLTTVAFAVQPVLTDDTSIALSGKTPNNGAKPTLAIDANHAALLRYDLSTLPAATTAAQVQQATLTVFTGKVKAAGALSLALVDGDYDETAAPDVTLKPLASSPVLALESNAGNSFVRFDITALVKGWISGAVPNNGVAVQADPSADGIKLTIDSKENKATSHAAKLEITLASAAAVGPQGPQGPAGAVGPAGPQGVAGATGPAGAQGNPGSQGNAGTPGTTGPAGPTGPAGAAGNLRVYGDGSAGAFVSAAGETLLETPNPQFTDFTVSPGSSLVIPSGTVIRCTGTFINRGTITVLNAANEGFLQSTMEAPASPGIALSPAGNGRATFVSPPNVTVGGVGGTSMLAQMARNILKPGHLGGGGGGAGGGSGIGGDGGGTLVVLARGAVSNVGVIEASGAVGFSGNGGGGGGIVILGSGTSISNNSVSSVIRAKGGKGANSSRGAGPGGGGGGGIIHLISPETAQGTAAMTDVSPGEQGESILVPTTDPRGSGGGGGGMGGGGGTGGSSGGGLASAGSAGHIFNTDVADPSGLF